MKPHPPNKPIELITLVLIALGVLHVLDHLFNQPARSIHVEVFVSAGLGWLALLLTLALAHRDHRLAPLLAFLVGMASALGFLASHVAPDFSVFSDSFAGLGVNALSWMLVALSVLASLVLALFGAGQLLTHDEGPRWTRKP